MNRYQNVFTITMLSVIMLCYGCGTKPLISATNEVKNPFPTSSAGENTTTNDGTATPDTKMIAGAASRTPSSAPAHSVPSTTPTNLIKQTPVRKPLELFENTLRSLPPDDYLVYTAAGDLYATSLDRKEQIKIGRSKGVFTGYSSQKDTFNVYDENCQCFIFYQLKNNQLEEIGRIPNAKGDQCGYWRNISPDLHWYVLVCGDPEKRLMLRDIKSGTEEVITSGGPGTDNPVAIIHPSWSPDAKWLIFFQTDLASTVYKNNSIVLVNFSCQQSSSDCAYKKSGPFIHGGDPGWGQYDAAWSPDSRQFAFIASGIPNSIQVFDISSKQFRSYSIEKHPITYLDWTPSGDQFIISEPAGIFTFSLKDQTIKKLVNGTSSDVYELVGWISTYSEPAFEVNASLTVTDMGKGVRVRSLPSIKGTVLEVLDVGDQINIQDGPQYADGYTWWRVAIEGSESVGWVAENQDWFITVK